MPNDFREPPSLMHLRFLGDLFAAFPADTRLSSVHSHTMLPQLVDECSEGHRMIIQLLPHVSGRHPLTFHTCYSSWPGAFEGKLDGPRHQAEPAWALLRHGAAHDSNTQGLLC